MRRLIGSLVCSGLVAVAASCGGSGSPAPITLVSSAGVKTSSAKTAKVSEDIKIVPGAAASATVPTSVHADGAINFLTHQADVSTTVAGQKIEVLVDGAVLYEHIPQLSQFLGGKPWLKLDLNALGKIGGISGFGALAQAGPSDPSQFLSYWKGVSGNVVTEGTETIRGVKTTKYRANVDFDKAAAAATDPTVRTAIQQVKKAIGTTVLPIDVWVDGQGRIRRQHQTFDYSHATFGTIPAASLPKSLDLTLEYYDFGAPVSIVLPPAGQVTDAGALLGAVAGGSG